MEWWETKEVGRGGRESRSDRLAHTPRKHASLPTPSPVGRQGDTFSHPFTPDPVEEEVFSLIRTMGTTPSRPTRPVPVEEDCDDRPGGQASAGAVCPARAAGTESDFSFDCRCVVRCAKDREAPVLGVGMGDGCGACGWGGGSECERKSARRVLARCERGGSGTRRRRVCAVHAPHQPALPAIVQSATSRSGLSVRGMVGSSGSGRGRSRRERQGLSSRAPAFFAAPTSAPRAMMEREARAGAPRAASALSLSLSLATRRARTPSQAF